MKLTRIERLILLQQKQILELLEPNHAKEHRRHQKLLEGGHEHFYHRELFRQVTEEYPDFVGQEVMDTLTMFRMIRNSVSAEEQQDLVSQNLAFAGYDGHEELDYLNTARYALDQRTDEGLGLFADLPLPNDLDSHAPKRPRYMAMLDFYHSIKSNRFTRGEFRQMKEIAEKINPT